MKTNATLGATFSSTKPVASAPPAFPAASAATDSASCGSEEAQSAARCGIGARPAAALKQRSASGTSGCSARKAA